MRLTYIGLIIFFILIVALGAIFLFRQSGAPEQTIGPVSFPEIAKKTALPFVKPLKPEEIKTITETEKPVLIQISREPMAGFAVLKNNRVRFAEKATGHIFETDLISGEIKIISNTTIPKILEAKFNSDGSKALLKYLEDENMRSVSAEFQASSTKGVLLPGPILSWGYYPETSDIFYYLKTKESPEGFSIIKATHKNANQKEIFSTPFGDYNAFWPKPEILGLTTKPSGLAFGFSYIFNPKTGGFSKILGDILGLETKWDKNNERFLYSNNDLNLFLYEKKVDKNSMLNFKTLAKKCAFSKTDNTLIFCAKPKEIVPGLYPDNWYQGVIGFSDEFLKINLKTGETNMLFGENDFDVLEIELADNDDFLYFRDKNTNLLFGLRLK